MQRIALGIEYDGSAYSGWQRQHHSPSVQALVESALTKVANYPINVFCGGRTDAGVHACEQVIHFDTDVRRVEHAWVLGTNSYLPKDIRILWCHFVDNTFDARKSALSRRYCYVINNRRISPGILNNAVTWIYGSLCISSMREAAQYLLGKHDFTSFRDSQCQAKTPIRTIQAIDLICKKELVLLDITANAFLHHMVRNIAGSLIAVGKSKHPPLWMKEVLAAKSRRFAAGTAPSQGLYLKEIRYPADYSLPSVSSLPWFLL